MPDDKLAPPLSQWVWAELDQAARRHLAQIMDRVFELGQIDPAASFEAALIEALQRADAIYTATTIALNKYAPPAA